MQQLKDLYEDWDSIEMQPMVKFFPIKVEKLFRNKEKAKGIIDHISGEMFLTKLKINGFEDKSWQYWTAPAGTAECDVCSYKFNETVGAERYYGGFSARLRSLEAKLNVTVDGQEKECHLVGLALKTNSIAHATVANQGGQTDDLNMFRLAYDFSFIWSPPIGIEIKEWTTFDDWRTFNLESRFHLETMKDNGAWPPFQTDFFSPLFHVYVDPECLNVSYPQAKYFNRKLSQHLDYKISGLVAGVMKSHFLIQAGRPHAFYKLQESNHSLTEWAMEMITSQQSFLDDVGQWFEGAGRTIVSGVEEVGRAISQATEELGQTLDKAGQAINQAVIDANKWIEQAKKDTGKWIDQAANDTIVWAESEEGQQFIEMATEVLENLADALQASKTGGATMPRPKYRPPRFKPPRPPAGRRSYSFASMKPATGRPNTVTPVRSTLKSTTASTVKPLHRAPVSAKIPKRLEPTTTKKQ